MVGAPLASATAGASTVGLFGAGGVASFGAGSVAASFGTVGAAAKTIGSSVLRSSAVGLLTSGGSGRETPQRITERDNKPVTRGSDPAVEEEMKRRRKALSGVTRSSTIRGGSLLQRPMLASAGTLG